ncbi:hypothetical protein [Miltoncostaea oceani]|uniref:hypothetical protein n=1 Tax=Miltoncostaea oceani TaxID=2843216 RepID=UPI001C3D1D53|nr:hypothetical protein [Miltoncostaea oceani]
MTPPDPPEIDAEDVEVIEHPDEGFDPDAPPEEIDAEQTRQAEIAERQKEWVNPREQVGGED